MNRIMPSKEYRRNERTDVSWRAKLQFETFSANVLVLDFSIRGFGITWTTPDETAMGQMARLELMEGPLAELPPFQTRVERISARESNNVGISIQGHMKPRVRLALGQIRQEMQRLHSLRRARRRLNVETG